MKKKKLDIIYEDKYLIIINKPSGILTISRDNSYDKNLYDEVKEYIKEGKFDGCNLDGGMARNTYIDPLIENNVDKILIISTRHNFELPQRVKEKIDNNKIVIISPKTSVDNKEMLNFSSEFCSKMYKEGYDIGLKFDLDLLKK